MEVLTSAWFLLLICCTDWYGFRQCVALPVPNLLNYYSGSGSNWNWKVRQSRDPIAYYDKFTFPNKELLPVEDRSGKGRTDSGKIYFPDEISAKQDRFQFYSDADIRPIWKLDRNPFPPFVGSSETWQSSPERETSTAMAVQPMQMQQHQLYDLDDLEETTVTEISNSDRSSLSIPLQPERDPEEDKVAAAVKQFYEWLKTKNTKQKKVAERPKIASNCLSAPALPSTHSTTHQPNKTGDSFVSDQSLVAGLKDQKCPDGQVRLENGECKAKVDV